MKKLVVCIASVFAITPLLIEANEELPIGFSLSSGYLSSQENTPSVQQREINFKINYDDFISFDLSPEANLPEYGDLIFNHYKQVFTTAGGESSVSNTAENEVQLHYLHFGSNYQLSSKGDVWFSAGLGVTYFSSIDSTINDDIKLSLSLGIHKDIAVSENSSIRLESRVYSIYFDGVHTPLCQQLACGNSDSLWFQNEVSLSINTQF